jgi:hypothetical protein
MSDFISFGMRFGFEALRLLQRWLRIPVQQILTSSESPAPSAPASDDT